MKKVLATLFLVGAAYFFTPTSAMADPVHFNVGVGFGTPAPYDRGVVVERPRREAFGERRFVRREEFGRRDWDRGRDFERRGREEYRR